MSIILERQEIQELFAAPICVKAHVDLFNDVRVRRVEFAEEAQVVNGLVTTSTGDEPARRLLEERDAKNEETTRDELDCARRSQRTAQVSSLVV